MICKRCKQWSQITVKEPVPILACPLCGRVFELGENKERAKLTLWARVKETIKAIVEWAKKE